MLLRRSSPLSRAVWLAGVVGKGDAQVPALSREVKHSLRIVGTDDDDIGIGQALVGEGEIAGVAHGAGVEVGDLVLLFVGTNKETRGEFVGDFDDMFGVDSVLVQPGPIIAEVLTYSAKEDGVAAKKFERVGDVCGRSSALANHVFYQETDAQAGQFFGNNLVGEPAGE